MMGYFSASASACTRNVTHLMHRPAVSRVLRQHRPCQAAVQAAQHRFFFDTEANSHIAEEADILSVAVIDEESGEFYSALVNPQLVDPSVPIITEATHIHGLQLEEILSDGIHLLVAIENVIAFINRKLLPGEQPVIIAHNGFKYHFRVLELCKQRALQQAAAAAAPAEPSSDHVSSSSLLSTPGTEVQPTSRRRRRTRRSSISSTALAALLESNPGSTDSPESACAGSTAVGNSTKIKSSSNNSNGSSSGISVSSSSSSSSALGSPSAAAGPVVAWPDGWLFQDTWFLLWALKAQTKDLDLQTEGYFTRLPQTLKLVDACAALLPLQQPPPTFLPRERALMQATNVGRLLPVLLNLLEPSPQADDTAAAAQTDRAGGAIHKGGGSNPEYSRSMREFDEMLRRNQDWLTKPWPLNPPDHPAGRFPTWAVSKGAWPLAHLPTGMMSAARQAAREGDGPNYLLEWYMSRAIPAPPSARQQPC